MFASFKVKALSLLTEGQFYMYMIKNLCIMFVSLVFLLCCIVFFLLLCSEY